MLSFSELENRITNKRLQSHSSNNVNIGYGLDIGKIKNINNFSPGITASSIMNDKKTSLGNSSYFNKNITKYNIDVKSNSRIIPDVKYPYYNLNDCCNSKNSIIKPKSYSGITSKLYGIPSLRIIKLENPASQALETQGVKTEKQFFAYRAKTEEFLNDPRLGNIINGVTIAPLNIPPIEPLDDEPNINVLPAFPINERRHEESKYDESKYDESKYDESKYDESKHDESKHDESKYDESKDEESKFEEEVVKMSQSLNSPRTPVQRKITKSKNIVSKVTTSKSNPKTPLKDDKDSDEEIDTDEDESITIGSTGKNKQTQFISCLDMMDNNLMKATTAYVKENKQNPNIDTSLTELRGLKQRCQEVLNIVPFTIRKHNDLSIPTTYGEFQIFVTKVKNPTIQSSIFSNLK